VVRKYISTDLTLCSASNTFQPSIHKSEIMECVKYLPFGLSRACISDDLDITHLAAVVAFEELVNLLLVCLQVEAVDQDRTVFTLLVLLLLL
jgi:hypothetical protein